MIISRIWVVRRRGAVFRDESSHYHSRLRFIMRIIVESALVYTTTSIFAFIAVALNSNIDYMAAGVVSFYIPTLYIRTNAHTNR
jgi:hypothetical protein